jgi:hypothetical protein
MTYRDRNSLERQHPVTVIAHIYQSNGFSIKKFGFPKNRVSDNHRSSDSFL